MDESEDTSDLSELPFEVLQKLQEKVGVKRFREYVKEQELRKKAKGSTTAWDDQDDNDGAGPAGQTSTAARQIACAMACCDVVHCTCVHGGLACGGLLALVCVGHASVGGRDVTRKWSPKTLRKASSIVITAHAASLVEPHDESSCPQEYMAMAK